MNQAIKSHIGNISRAVGSDISVKYNYIVSESELTNAYLKMRNDLGYPLMIDSKYRRAIVYNKEGLERKIKQMIAEVIKENEQRLADLIVNDVTTQLNNIIQMTNGLVTTKGGYKHGGIGKAIGSAMGSGLVNGFFKVLDDITDYDADRRR